MADDIRHADDIGLPCWPDDTPFPLTDTACAALLRGHAVRWVGSIEDLDAMPGRFELIEGWLFLHRR